MHRKFSAAITGNQQERKAIEHGGLTAILNRQETPRLVDHEVANRHLAAQDERGETRDQSQHHQDSAAEFEYRRSQDQWRMMLLMPSKDSKQLLRSVTHKEKAEDDPERRVRKRLQSTENFHALIPLE